MFRRPRVSGAAVLGGWRDADARERTAFHAGIARRASGQIDGIPMWQAASWLCPFHEATRALRALAWSALEAVRVEDTGSAP